MLQKFSIFGMCLSVALGSSFSTDEIKKNINSIKTEQFVELLKNQPNTKVLDVRIKSDILSQGGYIKTNKYFNISRDKLEYLIENDISKDEKVVVYCYNGNISLLAAKTLKEMGYKDVLWYEDSYKIWNEHKNPISSLDFDTNSILYNKVKKVQDGIYTSIGATQPPSYENSGHNNNLGFIEGDDSILVWNASANYLLAKSFHEEIKKITNKPVKYVILENSQGHAMLGSSYWKEQGATIVSHEIAKDEIIKQGEDILNRHSRIYKDKALGTKIVIPDVTFKDDMKFDLGNKIVEAKYFGYAHEHSDIAIWLPKEEILFAGDLAFHQRLLPIFEITETLKWIEAFDEMAKLNAKIVIPGHGDVTDMQTVTKYTKDYLIYLRQKVQEAIDEDKQAYEIDQSPYEHLDTFKELARQNASRLYKMMEFE